MVVANIDHGSSKHTELRSVHLNFTVDLFTGKAALKSM